MILQIKILNEINFFPIIIYILLQFKVYYLFPLQFLFPTNIQNAFYWSIDHNNVLQLIAVHLDWRW